MGNTCSFDNTIPGITTEMPRRNESLYDFKYGADILSPNVQHEKLDIFKRQTFRERLLPILEKLGSEHKLYKDPDFNTAPLVLKSKDLVKQCKWVRPTKFMAQQDKYTILKQTKPDCILVSDEVVQYFGMFLIMLSQNPELIDQTIELVENSFGLNVIRMYQYGVEKHVLIDDYILCDDRSVPVFSQAEKMQAWPLLVEKCWMKVLWPVSEIESLRPEQPIEEFLGLPTRTIVLQGHTPAHISKTILHKVTEKGFFCFMSKQNPAQMIGLSGRKHFALLDHFTADGIQYFLLRNPLGRFQFRGNYAVPSPSQLNSLKALGYNDLKPGNFIVDSEQIVQQFETMTMAYYQKGYKLCSRQFQCKRNTVIYFRFRIKKPGPICLRVQQHSEGGVSNYRFSPFMIDLIQVDPYRLVADGSEESYWGGRNIDFFDRVMEDLEPGNYIIRLEPKWISPSTERTASLIAYCNYDIDFQIREQQACAQQFMLFLKKQGQKALELDRKIHGQIAYQIKWLKNRVLVYIKNISKRRKGFKVELDFPMLQNLECVNYDITKVKSAMLDLEDDLLVVFEKMVLTEETAIKQYFINPF